MKIAEALMLRADLQKRINSLSTRARENARMRAGEDPVEDPSELLEAIQTHLKELRKLIEAINHANNSTSLEDDSDTSLIQALILRDQLTREHEVITSIASASTSRDRWMEREAMEVHVNVTELRSTADDLGQQIRELNAKIQKRNWEVDL